ncbi:MAG: hypothetical protein RQ758_06250 [Methanomicrobiaceae archaeon]|nr:hypothetical protein [Methanomicrobiaceae archaeon]
MIRKLLATGAIAYGVLALVQYLQNPVVRAESVIIAALLGGIAILGWVAGDERLRRGEMVAVWGAVFLFVIYALLGGGG